MRLAIALPGKLQNLGCYFLFDLLFGHSVQAYAQTDQADKARQVGVKMSEDPHESDGFYDEKRKKQGVDLLQLRSARSVLQMEVTQRRCQKPGKANEPKYSKGDDHAQEPIVVSL